MMAKIKDWFKRPSEPVPAPKTDVIRKGVPSYARYRHRKSEQPPLYDKTGEFLDLNPLADIPIGNLARPQGAALEAPIWGVDDWLDGDYEPFPWNPDETEHDVIINEERL
jgi:hypothetical protein